MSLLQGSRYNQIPGFCYPVQNDLLPDQNRNNLSMVTKF